MQRILRKMENNANFFGVAMMLPAVIVVAVLVLYPLLYSLYLSVYNVSLLMPGQKFFIGLNNYIEAIKAVDFRVSVGRTFIFVVTAVWAELVLGMTFALLLNREFKGGRISRTLMIAPFVLPTIVFAVLWQWILDPTYGPLNSLLMQLGLIQNYHNWLGSASGAMTQIIIADIWKNTPLVTLFILSGLQGIPNEIYESSQIDGASQYYRFTRITLPLLRPTILVVTVLRTMEAFKIFDLVYVLTGGGPSNGTKVIAFHIYEKTFKALNFGQGAAVSYLVFIVILLMAIVYFKLIYSEVEY